ncbi:MAG: sulfur carrier protein ThiS adenylyltransferase ThiF [Clostridium sp.]
MEERNAPGISGILRGSKVAIAGCGGLGSNIAISLCRIGVGEISIYDFDIIEASNLNRQQYYYDDIGKKKVSTLENILRNINPFIKINAIDVYLDKNNMEELLKGHNVIVEAFDNPECKATIANVVLGNLKESYLVSGSGMAGYSSSNKIITRRVTKKLYVCGDGETGYTKEVGIMAPRVCITANHMANMVLRLLLNEEEV